MKKLLTILSSFGLIVSTGITIVGCGNSIVSDSLDIIITKTDLGNIDDNSSIKILSKLKELNNHLIASEVTVSNSTLTSAIISAKPGSNVYSGSVFVTFVAEKTSIETVLMTTNLGIIANNEPETIIDAILKAPANKELDSSQIEVVNITEIGARIQTISESKTYVGFINVSFTLSDEEISTIPLNSIITNINLGILNDNDEETIILAVVSANNQNEININEIEIKPESITETGATIRAIENSTVYSGEVDIHFTIRIKLENVIENTAIIIDVDELDKILESELIEILLLEKIKEYNNNLIIDEVHISDMNLSIKNAGSIVISVNSDSNIYFKDDLITINFYINLNSIFINDEVEVPEEYILFLLNDDIEQNFFLELAIFNKYINLNSDEVEVEQNLKETLSLTDGGEILIKVKEGSTVYGPGQSTTINVIPISTVL